MAFVFDMAWEPPRSMIQGYNILWRRKEQNARKG